ncbi:hypothetical protein PHA8399_00851 [Leisingera aquaemixtae]|uniref:Uncharacterized protein n=1 Tax=Leisingera aquaemixtae TaxID=1396826 RepID=A0A0P1H749_9RHOB|nr:hypothetical protein PHA8399_00851 [Leisingera aquaemixtae]
MLSYDWIVLITLGLDRWEHQRRPLAPHEIELEAARRRHTAQQAAKPARSGLLKRLFSRRRARPAPGCPRPGRPHKRASRA